MRRIQADTCAANEHVAISVGISSLQAGSAVVRAEDLRRVSREALPEQRFPQPIVAGWYMPSQPDAWEGDTSPWVGELVMNRRLLPDQE
jgi:hypothetical protein